MKRFWLLAIAAFSLTIFTTSCGEDETPAPPVEENFAPSISILAENPTSSGNGIITSDVTFELENATTIFYVAIEGADATPPMSTLEIYYNGVAITEDNLVSITTSSDEALGLNNPALLVSPYDSLFSFEIGLRTGAEFGVNTYEFVVTDDEGLTASTTIAVTTVEAGTPITLTEVDGVIFNASGPNMGAFDLDNFTSVSSSSDLSELQDNGIDNSLPASENWRRTISPENGATMVEVNRSALGEAYDFYSVETKEEILAAWDSGTVISDATDVIEAGDEFVVFANDTYFHIRITEVNATTGDNLDNYVLDMRY